MKMGLINILVIIGLMFSVWDAGITFGKNISLLPKDENIYLVISRDLSEKQLTDIEAEFNKRAMSVYFDDIKYEKGKLSSVSVLIQIPGVYQEEIYTERLSSPIMFYYEPGRKTRVGLTYQMPHEISARGKALFDNNLTGLFIEGSKGLILKGNVKIN